MPLSTTGTSAPHGAQLVKDQKPRSRGGVVVDGAQSIRRIVVAPASVTYGLLPALSLIGAFGLLLIAVADNGARTGVPWAESLFWTGLLALFVPIAARLGSETPSRPERVGLAGMLAVELYVVKLLHSPVSFTLYDELLNWRTASDIVQSGFLFHQNPLHPIGSLFPGLGIVTSALVSLSGLPIFTAGIVLIGVARLVFVIVLYLFYEEIARSARVAGIATLLYMTNPSFLWFDAMFSYESLALPFAALALFALARRANPHQNERTGLTVVALLAIGATTITHHLTSYALVAFLLVWTLAHLLRVSRKAPEQQGQPRDVTAVQTRLPGVRKPVWFPSSAARTVVARPGSVGTAGITAYVRVAFLLVWILAHLLGVSRKAASESRGDASSQEHVCSVREPVCPPEDTGLADVTRLDSVGVGGIGLIALVTGLAWLVYVAAVTVHYLVSIIWPAVNQLVKLAAGEALGRRLFDGFTGQVAPLWEQVVAYAAVGLILLILPYGLLRVWRWRANSAALALAVGALAYPLSQVIRLTDKGVDVAGRVPEFLFVAVAFVLAVAVEGVRSTQRRGRWWTAAFAVWVGIIFAGGVVSWPTWARLPGPYLVGAESRSIEAQGVTTAEWARSFLGPGNRVISDRINGLLLGSYGEQRPVSLPYDGVNFPPVFFSKEVGGAERAILRQGAVRYVVTDLRLSTALPVLGFYFVDGEPDTFQHTTPIPRESLTKFDRVENVSRVFDSGDIVIYDFGGLTGAP